MKLSMCTDQRIGKGNFQCVIMSIYGVKREAAPHGTQEN